MHRGAGILLHVTSLPDGFDGAHGFIDFLSNARVKYWQILAANPTGYGDSPYAPLSSFALNPAFCSGSKIYDRASIGRFIKKHKYWLEPYALYMAIKESQGEKDWLNWDKKLRDFSGAGVAEFKEKNADKIEKHIAIQMNLFERWAEIKNYANERGIQIIGDIPFYPAMDSADVWEHTDLFEFENGAPKFVAGVSPDYFNADGQLWGNPIYDWKKLTATKFKWWIERLKHMQEICNIVRIDHFRAFDSYYKIPYGEKTARVGEWVDGVGFKFFDTVQKQIPDIKIILEDLGDIGQRVKDLRDKTGYGGMRVMQFGFVHNAENEHLPDNYPQNCTAYLGTHDNDTFIGFLDKLNADQRGAVDEYLHSWNLDKNDVCRLAIENLMQSRADIILVTMQDLLFQGTKYRMNTPGTLGGNWGYKIDNGQLTPVLADCIKLLIERSGR